MGKKTRPILLVFTFHGLTLQEFETANELQLFGSITALASIGEKFSVYFSIKTYPFIFYPTTFQNTLYLIIYFTIYFIKILFTCLER